MLRRADYRKMLPGRGESSLFRYRYLEFSQKIPAGKRLFAIQYIVYGPARYYSPPMFARAGPEVDYRVEGACEALLRLIRQPVDEVEVDTVEAGTPRTMVV